MARRQVIAPKAKIVLAHANAERARIDGFVRHPWPYPSAYSLAGCISRIHVLDRRDFLGLWLSKGKVVAIQSAPTPKGLVAVVGEQLLSNTFRLDPMEQALAFRPERWWPKSLRALASSASDGLRICVDCLRQGFHTGLFQLPWWRACPIHNQPLKTRCPACGTRLAYSTELLVTDHPDKFFRCVECQAEFANTRAVVMADRNHRDDWHRIVKAHLDWSEALDSRFLLAPQLASQKVEAGSDFVLQLIHAAGVPFPAEIQPYVAVLSSRLNCGLHFSIDVDGTDDVEKLRLLGMPTSRDLTSEGKVREYLLSTELQIWLVRLDRRLQSASLLSKPRSSGKLGTVLNGSQIVPAPNSMARPASDIARATRDRAYCCRAFALAIEECSGGAVLRIAESAFSDLSAFRLLRSVARWRRELLAPDHIGTNHEDSSLARHRFKATAAILDWIYSRLTAIAVLDATVDVVYRLACRDPRAKNPDVVPGWPTVELDRFVPGHEWTCAVIANSGRVTAFLAPVRSSRTCLTETHKSELRPIPN